MTSAVIRNMFKQLSETNSLLYDNRKEAWILKDEYFLINMLCLQKFENKERDSIFQKEIFVEYERNSPSYLVFYPENERVHKQGLVNFFSNVRTQNTQDLRNKWWWRLLPKEVYTKLEISCNSKTQY